MQCNLLQTTIVKLFSVIISSIFSLEKLIVWVNLLIFILNFMIIDITNKNSNSTALGKFLAVSNDFVFEDDVISCRFSKFSIDKIDKNTKGACITHTKTLSHFEQAKDCEIAQENAQRVCPKIAMADF